MGHELVVAPDEEALSSRAAEFVAACARSAVSVRGKFTFAVSGGHTPWAMFANLVKDTLPWQVVQVFQVDERVAPDGAPERNLTHLREALGDAPAEVMAMPVTDADLEEAAARYAQVLPGTFDLVHLGLGPDGHTASLVPSDPVLDVADRLVAVTRPYQGHRRMTLTYPALERAAQTLWLVAGQDKREALAKLLAADPSIPAGRLRAQRSTILADVAAAEGLGSP
ncbi:MAG TPA: 6-phosphogluconolactonase [Acidimicrobiales bacterium]|nr:6-phosphogluconolactonase [Acidimicrobiales bacterium]